MYFFKKCCEFFLYEKIILTFWVELFYPKKVSLIPESIFTRLLSVLSTHFFLYEKKAQCPEDIFLYGKGLFSIRRTYFFYTKKVVSVSWGHNFLLYENSLLSIFSKDLQAHNQGFFPEANSASMMNFKQAFSLAAFCQYPQIFMIFCTISLIIMDYMGIFRSKIDL